MSDRIAHDVLDVAKNLWVGLVVFDQKLHVQLDRLAAEQNVHQILHRRTLLDLVALSVAVRDAVHPLAVRFDLRIVGRGGCVRHGHFDRVVGRRLSRRIAGRRRTQRLHALTDELLRSRFVQIERELVGV